MKRIAKEDFAQEEKNMRRSSVVSTSSVLVNFLIFVVILAAVALLLLAGSGLAQDDGRTLPTEEVPEVQAGSAPAEAAAFKPEGKVITPDSSVAHPEDAGVRAHTNHVPADYVITPFGYFHPSCVTHLAKGDVVRQDENAIQHANGTYDNIHGCAYAHYKADGEEVTGDERAVKQPTISHAWVEAASTTTSTSFGYLSAYWNVPPAPSTNDGQVVYLFPGMEDDSDVVTIIQPVLGWNADYASAWGIASWNCCTLGTVFEAPPTRVHSGDTIDGYMFATCASGTLSCPSWDIVTYDVTSGNYSELLNTSSQGQTFNWAFAGALEGYNIAQCGDYPSNGAISFYNVGLYNYKSAKIVNPAWSVFKSSGLTPQCGYGGSLPKQVTLNY